MNEPESFNINFVNEVNEWAKKQSYLEMDLKDTKASVLENIDNILHNYELIAELKGEVVELKHEMQAIKLILIAGFKKEKQKSTELQS